MQRTSHTAGHRPFPMPQLSTVVAFVSMPASRRSGRVGAVSSRSSRRIAGRSCSRVGRRKCFARAEMVHGGASASSILLPPRQAPIPTEHAHRGRAPRTAPTVCRSRRTPGDSTGHGQSSVSGARADGAARPRTRARRAARAAGPGRRSGAARVRRVQSLVTSALSSRNDVTTDPTQSVNANWIFPSAMCTAAMEPLARSATRTSVRVGSVAGPS